MGPIFYSSMFALNPNQWCVFKYSNRLFVWQTCESTKYKIRRNGSQNSCLCNKFRNVVFIVFRNKFYLRKTVNNKKNFISVTNTVTFVPSHLVTDHVFGVGGSIFDWYKICMNNYFYKNSVSKSEKISHIRCLAFVLCNKMEKMQKIFSTLELQLWTFFHLSHKLLFCTSAKKNIKWKVKIAKQNCKNICIRLLNHMGCVLHSCNRKSSDDINIFWRLS